jgi:hypothetical protein
MSLLSPPPGCKTAYIQNSEVLIVPSGVSLPALCVKCGERSETEVRKTFHWPPWQPGFGPFVPIGLLIFLIKRLLHFDERVNLDIPLCHKHSSRRRPESIAGLGCIAMGSALVVVNFKAIDVRAPYEAMKWGGTVALIVGGVILFFIGFHVLDVVEVNDQFSAYKGFGLGYMEQVPCETEVFPQRRS